MSATPRMNWSLVEECLDEAEFLWATRERGLDAHNQNVERLRTWTEERLHGCLDGIAAAGDTAVELLTAALQEDRQARVSVAAFTLATLNSQASADALMGILPETVNLLAIRRGLELSASDLFQQRLQPLAGRSSQILALLTDIRAFQGVDAEDKLAALWAHPDDDVKASTLRLAKNSPRHVASNLAMAALQMENPEIRAEAMDLGLMTGVGEAWKTALDIVDKRQPGYTRAAVAVAALGDARENDRLVAAYTVEDRQRDALFASGFAGTVIAADALLAAMKSGILPRVAAESFCAITGLDLEQEKMALPEPAPPDEIPFEQDDLNANLVPKADEELPLPDVAAVERWWTENRKRFPANERFVAGRPWSLATLHERLMNGPMRRRHGWAFEAAARTQGTYQVQIRAFMAAQQQQLGKLGENLQLLKYHRNSWSRGR
jgi:uncharacterized protein (TIGR02270 family)